MGVVVRFDPTANSTQTQIIDNVSLKNDGVLSKEQYAAILAGGGGSSTIAQTYANGASAADQTASIDPAKGGGIIAQAASAAVGALLSALTSVSGVVFQAIDAAIPKVLAAGTFIQNDPDFGSPVMGSQTPGGFMSYTADGQGPEFGGTGITAQQNGDASFITFSVNDISNFVATVFGLTVLPTVGLGVNPDTGAMDPFAFVSCNLYSSANAVVPITSNTLAPTTSVSEVGAGLIKNITPPITGFIGTIALQPTAGFTYDATGNILVAAGGGTAVVNRTMFATYNGTKWTMSY